MTRPKNEKYYAILAGALRTFAENGFHKTQVSRIAKAAGVADGTIYLYFKRKEDILIELFREKLGELVGKFHATIDEHADAAESLRKVVEIHFGELEKDANFAYVTQIELRQSDLELRREIGASFKPYIVLIENILRRGIEQGRFRSDLDPKLTRLLVFGGMDEVVTSWLISGRKYSLSSQADGTVSFFLQGLKA